MNEIVSFSKEIEFNTDLYKITSISIEHTISLDKESNIKGDLIVGGTYRISSVTQIDTPFSYKVPVDIVMDSKYDLSNITIDIDNFTYDVINNNALKIDVDLIIDNIVKKEDDDLIDVNDLFLENEEDKKLDIPIVDTTPLSEDCSKEKEEKKENNTESLFSNFNSSSETYSTYSVYIMKENDTIETTMEKYKVSKKDLEEYNNLDDLKTGTKLIVPNSNE